MKQDIEELRQAITREAERDRQRIIGDAQARVEAIRAQAQAQVAEETAHLVEAARAKAARLRQEVIGAAGLDAQAFRARARESVLDLVFSRAAEALAKPSAIPDYAAVVESLIVDAVTHLGGWTLVVHADVETQAVLADRNQLGQSQTLLDRISQQTGSQLTLGQVLSGGTGVVVESPDGHVRYDNTLQTRMARMRSTLRAPIYEILVRNEP